MKRKQNSPRRRMRGRALLDTSYYEFLRKLCEGRGSIPINYGQVHLIRGQIRHASINASTQHMVDVSGVGKCGLSCQWMLWPPVPFPNTDWVGSTLCSQTCKMKDILWQFPCKGCHSKSLLTWKNYAAQIWSPHAQKKNSKFTICGQLKLLYN